MRWARAFAPHAGPAGILPGRVPNPASSATANGHTGWPAVFEEELARARFAEPWPLPPATSGKSVKYTHRVAWRGVVW